MTAPCRRFARYVVHHPWHVIVGWVVLAIAAIAFLPGLGSVTSQNDTSFLPSGYQSVQAERLAARAFPATARETALVVIERTDGARLSAADQTDVTRLLTRLSGERFTGVLDVPESAAYAENRLVAVDQIVLDGTHDTPELEHAVAELRAAVADGLAGTRLTAGITGDVAVSADGSATYDHAALVVGVATVALILLLMLAIFRSPVAAVLPLASVGLVYAIAPRVIAGVADLLGFRVAGFLPTMLTVVLFGIGTDYLLFLLFRYRERLRLGERPREALVSALTRVTEVVACAAGAVIVAFGVLVLATFRSYASLGPGLAIAVLVMALAALTLIPAVVSLLGPRVFWPSHRSLTRRHLARGVAHRVGALVGRRPAVVAGVAGLVLAALAAGAYGMRADYSTSSQLPAGTESARALTALERGFPAGTSAPTEVYLASTDGRALSHAAVDGFAAGLIRLPGVAGLEPAGPSQASNDVGAYVAYGANGTVAEITVILTDTPTSAAALNTVDGVIRPYARQAAPAASTALVGGETASTADMRAATGHDLRVVLPVAGILIALILVLLLRSAVAPWYLMPAVGLAFAGTLGAATLVFQRLGGQAGVNFFLPMMIYLFVVAVGTDYNILMVARLREESREGYGPRRAAARAVRHATPSIAAAGLLLGGTFMALMFSGVGMLTQLGFTVSVGIALSAFVVAGFFVPALTTVLGDAAWWPARRHRSTHHDDVDLEAAALEAALLDEEGREAEASQLTITDA